MCIQCDGRIPLDADLCPYCSTELSKPFTSPPQMKDLHHQSLEQRLTGAYAPPYTARVGSLNNPKPPSEPMVEKRNYTSPSLGSPILPQQAAETAVTQENKIGFFPILLLSLGANLLTIGLLQLLFSDRGFLRLEWDSHYWFVYCLAALPLFYIGLKKANS